MLIFITFFYHFQASLFPEFTEEKTMGWKTWKNGNNNNMYTKRQAPWNFQNVCTILIYSLDHLFQAQLASWKQREIWQTLRFTNIHERSITFSTVPTQNYSQFALTLGECQQINAHFRSMVTQVVAYICAMPFVSLLFFTCFEFAWCERKRKHEETIKRPQQNV